MYWAESPFGFVDRFHRSSGPHVALLKMGLKITMGYTKFVIGKDPRSQPPDSPEDEREFIRGQTKCRP